MKVSRTTASVNAAHYVGIGIVIALALGMAGRGGAAAQAAQGSVTGTVVRADGSGPVAKATVTLGNVSVATGEDGRFAFPRVEPGAYVLTVAAVGFMAQEYGPPNPPRPGGGPAKIVVGPGARIANVVVTLVAAGVIVGRVVDADGIPIFGAQVEALQYSYQDGWRVLVAATPLFRTNDLGDFRVYWLAPGHYILRASPPRPESGRDEIAPTYFPGVTDPRLASDIVVQSAETLGINLKMSATRLARVAGSVIDGLSGRPAAAQLTLAPQTPEPAQLLYRGSAASGSGAFSIQGVLPGSYFLYATGAGAGANRLVTRVPIEIGDRDLDHLTLVTKPLPLQGRVTIDWPADFDPSRVRPRMAVQLQLAPPILAVDERQDGIAPRLEAAVNDGAFAFPTVMPADYQVALNIAIPGFADAYVKSLKLLDTDVIDEGLHLDNRAEPWLDVVVGWDGASLAGVVMDDQKQPLAQATVVLVPNRRQQFTRYKDIQTDAMGRFQLRGIAPGEYKLFAWEHIESVLWLNTDAMQANESDAAVVRAVEGAHVAGIELAVLPWRPLP